MDEIQDSGAVLRDIRAMAQDRPEEAASVAVPRILYPVFRFYVNRDYESVLVVAESAREAHELLLKERPDTHLNECCMEWVGLWGEMKGVV